MEPPPSPSVVTGLTALILVFFLTIPSVVKLFKSYSRGKYARIDALYEDEDGSATEESQTEYSATLPKYIALLSSMIGFIASTISAAFTTIHPTRNLYVENWLLFGSWVRSLTLSERSRADSEIVTTKHSDHLQYY